MNVVVIDTRHHARNVPANAILGGLTLLERALRVAARCGWERAVVLGDRAALPLVETPRIEVDYTRELSPELTAAPVMRSDALYEHRDGLHLVQVLETEADLDAAEQALWEGCRKDADGIISRHINRHISLAISRAIAHTGVMPNHVTAVTFSLGVASAVFAAIGGWAAFAIGGLLFQLTSVLDGVDGELARVRMDGSVLGEWLDTISDDSSDLLFYLGIGIGAGRTLYASPTIPPSVWLGLGIAAALGKLASMFVYYRWLAAHGRGDLLAFQWSFDDEPNRSALSKVLSVVRYATKNDFIAFTVMILGILNLLPYLLFAAVPGTLGVAIGAVLESRDDDDATGEDHLEE